MITENVKRITTTISEAALRAGRDPLSIELVAVTKFHPLEQILPLHGLGIKSIGESRIQELQSKFDPLQNRFKIHFIGHLQTNKAKMAVAMADLIHSVDSVKLASAVNIAAAAAGKTQNILLQVNCSNEEQKGGIHPSDFEKVLAEVSTFKNLKIEGLMTMAALTEDREAIRESFSLLRTLRDKTGLRHLSMGMSHDFDIAIEEGATLVRIGSAIFEGIS
ncbi:MAG: YggS family pyridoxal phosphate-dependent enzyme [Fibrobacteres bacterium]|nr:YggS family pyridoxal phosphate-dependent enzyme [Fibrobacterota bacterium]